MLVNQDGKPFKYVCPDCGCDNIGESGLGERYLHCFNSCMRDFSKSSCPTVLVTFDEEMKRLSQDAY